MPARILSVRIPSTLRGRPLVAFAIAATCGLAALAPASAAPGSAAPSSRAPLRLAVSALGDLSPYRRIASDTLALVDKGDLAAARARVKDLETAWDRAEASLKAKDRATWTDLDGMIDAALTDLRTPNPTPATCATSLKALIARLDAVNKA